MQQQLKLRLLLVPLLIIALTLFTNLVHAQNAYLDAGLQVPTVTSDKDDYAPGEVAHITGKGWKLDQQVHVEFKEEPDYPDFHIYDVNVDAEGNWKIDYQVETRHIGVKFTVLVTGKQTSYLGSTIFTDGNIRVKTSSGTISIQATVYASSSTCGGTGGTPATTNDIGTANPGVTVAVANLNQSAFIKAPATNSAGGVFVSWTTTETYSAPDLTKPYEICVTGKNGVLDLTANYTVPCTAPTINPSGQPNSRSITYGANTTFTVDASGTAPLSYQWEEFISSWNTINNGGVYSGATSATLTLTKPTVSMSGRKYRCVVSNSCGNVTTNGNATLTVAAKALTINGAAAQSKTYDGNTDAVITGTLTGVVGTENVTFNGTGTFATKNVGTGIAVTSTSTLSGTDKDNYSLTQPTGLTANITAKALTINSAAAQDKTYDGNTDAIITGTLIGVIGTEDVTLSGTGTFATRNVGTDIAVTSTSTLTGTAKNNYSLTQPTGLTADITAKALTINGAAAQNKVYDGNTDAVITGTLTGVIGTEDVAFNGTGTFSTKNVGTGISVTSTSTLTGTAKNNYSLTQPTGLMADVSAKGLTISGATAQSKIYNGNTDAVITGTLIGVVGTENVTFSGTGTFATKNVGTGIAVTSTSVLTGTDKNNYSLTQPTGLTADINAKALTITNAAAQSKTYDGNTDAVITGTLTGVIGTEDVTLSGIGTFATQNVGTGIAVTSTSTLTGTDKDNYSLTQPTGLTANITAKALTINSAAAQGKVYDGNTAAVITGILSGVIGTEDVTFNGTGTFATKNVGAGIVVTSTSTLAGTDKNNYSLTQPSGLMADITARELTINGAAAQSKTYDGNTAAVITGTLTGVVGTENVTFSGTGTFTTQNVGTGIGVTSTSTLTGTDKNNYSLTQPTSLTANISARPLNFAGTRMYDGTTTITAALLSTGNLVGSDVVNITGSATISNADVGTYTGFVTNSLISSNTNYKTTGGTVSVTITPQTANPVADAYYTGPSFYWTTGTGSKTATLTLTATIKNNINYTGDIRTAKVSFFFRNGSTKVPISGAQNLPVGLVNPGDLSVGTASKNIQYTISGTAAILNIGVEVSGNYTGISSTATDGQVQIAIPTPGGLITGGGKLDNTTSAGFVKGAPAPVKTEFSFYVQYNKSLTNPQGGVEITVRSYNDRNGNLTSVLHTYKLKSNAISVLSVKSPNAQFTSKANISEMVNGVEQAIEGNCTMQLDMYDANAGGATPNTVDQLAVTVFRSKGGVWYSNNWDGSKTLKKDIFNGLISVTGNGASATPSVSSMPVAASQNMVTESGKFDLIASPNPTTTQFSLKLVSDVISEPISLKVVNFMGSIVETRKNLAAGQTIQFGANYVPGDYFVELIQGSRSKLVKLVKLPR